jgi:hypothetical protein
MKKLINIGELDAWCYDNSWYKLTQNNKKINEDTPYVVKCDKEW